MLYGIRNKRLKRKNTILLLPLVIAVMIAFTACSAPKGSILILENPNGKEFFIEFKDWSSNNECKLSLNAGDEIRVDVDREKGEIDLTISGKNGSEPYTGNNLESFLFTVAVSETDEYAIKIAGKKATGKITVKVTGNKENE
jgi:hypothetical protein